MARIPLSRRIAFSLMVAAGLWLVAEAVVMRVYRTDLEAWASPPAPPRKGVAVLNGNPYLIYEYPPGEHFENGVTVHINSLGLRGDEVEIPKPPGVRRLLTTGDSSIFGFGVEDEEVFSEVAERLLGPPVEAVCGAIPGYSTFQTINLLRMRALRVDPDLLVVGNLWSDNNFDSFVDKEVLATYAGFEESTWGRLRALASHSAIFRVLDWRLRVRERARAIRKVGWMVDSGPKIGLRRVEINDYARNLQTIVDIARNRGADVVFLLLPNREDLADPQPTEPRAWDPYREVMRDTAERNGAPLLDLVRTFRDSGRSADELFIDLMHPTPLGHRLMGEALAALLREAGWPEGRSVMGEPEPGPLPRYEDPFVDPTAAAASSGAGATVDAARPAASGRPVVSGVLRFDGYRRGIVQLDVFDPAGTAPRVLGSAQLRGPGEFSIPLNATGAVAMRVYLDEDEDGPDAGDLLVELRGGPFEVGEEGLGGLVVDVDHARVERP